MRLSYVTWQEGVDPLIIIELLSPNTEKDDLGQRLRVPYYVVFRGYTNELRIFTLNGSRYQEAADHQGRFWIKDVELGLGVWQGPYLNEEFLWLRWYDRDGNWIPTADERAEQERQEKEAARQKVEQLAAKLRELGIDPDQI